MFGRRRKSIGERLLGRGSRFRGPVTSATHGFSERLPGKLDSAVPIAVKDGVAPAVDESELPHLLKSPITNKGIQIPKMIFLMGNFLQVEMLNKG